MTVSADRLLAWTMYILVLCALVHGTLCAAEPMIVLGPNGRTLATVDTSVPSVIIREAQISGLQTDEFLVGIDFRPAYYLTHRLYGVSSMSRLYTINLDTGAISAVDSGAFSPALSGSNFGIDFDPVADRLRIVSDTGQNLRLNPDTGAVAAVDTSFAFDASDVHTGSTPAVSAIAYTNSFFGATTASLLSIDAANDVLTTIGSENGPISPNTGLLFTLGSIGLNARTDIAGAGIGLDVSPNSGVIYALVARDQLGSELYSIWPGPVTRTARHGYVSSRTSFRSPYTALDLAIPFTDRSPPELSKTAPLQSRLRQRGSVRAFRGTASDNLQLKEIRFRTVRGSHVGAWISATGIASWTFTVGSLAHGVTRVQVQAVDISGNVSEIATTTITRTR